MCDRTAAETDQHEGYFNVSGFMVCSVCDMKILNSQILFFCTYQNQISNASEDKGRVRDRSRQREGGKRRKERDAACRL